jgi:hypothetical protein
MKSIKLPKIGKRGWLGVVFFAIGLMTFVQAHSQAETETQQSSNEDGVNVSGYQNAVAQEAGYGSFTDALADQNRKSGTFFMGVGAVLVVWGFWKYSWKNSRVEKSQNDQVEKSTQ